jgi:hypothetical protein
MFNIIFYQLRAPKLPLGGLGVPSTPMVGRAFTGLSSVCAYFLSFPLKTKKGVSFTNWYQVYNMVINKEHLSKEGLEKVRSIVKTINSDK